MRRKSNNQLFLQPLSFKGKDQRHLLLHPNKMQEKAKKLLSLPRKVNRIYKNKRGRDSESKENAI